MEAAFKTIDVRTRVMPRVLMVSNHWGSKQEARWTCVFITDQLKSLRNAGVEIHTFDVGTNHSPFNIFRKWLELREQVRRLNPDLIHAQYGTIVSFLAAFASRPVVVSYCGNDLLPGHSVSDFRMCLGFLLSNLAALRAQGLICKSENLRQALWWRRGRAVVIPNGVDLDLFSPGSQNEARKELGWDNQQPVVLFNGGSDLQRKGLDVAEAAMPFVRIHLPAAKLHVLSKVEPTRMPLYYRAADVLLCASKTEGSPNVVKEALACNLPVVSCPVGDVAERLKGVYPSEVVRRDSAALGKAITKILQMRMRSNGREKVASLGLDLVAQRVLGIYRLVLEAT